MIRNAFSGFYSCLVRLQLLCCDSLFLWCSLFDIVCKIAFTISFRCQFLFPHTNPQNRIHSVKNIDLLHELLMFICCLLLLTCHSQTHKRKTFCKFTRAIAFYSRFHHDTTVILRTRITQYSP